MSVLNQTDVCHFKQFDVWAEHRIRTLELAQRHRCLKCRGLPEGDKENSEVSSFVAKWLVSIFRLETGLTPITLKAPHIGTKIHPCLKGPQDIPVELMDACTKRNET